jgi:hypothetical protein
MTTFRRTDTKVQLYFNCPEKVDRIGRMCKSTNYEDMTVIISAIGERDLIAKHIIMFGKGWMGKDAGIKGVGYVSEGPKGIRILITISESIDVIDCWLESLEDRIHLGEPTDIVYDWLPNSVTWTELTEELEEMRARHEEETDEERFMRECEECVWFGKLLKEMDENEWVETPVRAGMRNVLFGKD